MLKECFLRLQRRQWSRHHQNHQSRLLWLGRLMRRIHRH
jgi:hypothetical protein